MEYLSFIYPDWTKEAEQPEVQETGSLHIQPSHEPELAEPEPFTLVSEDCDRSNQPYPTLYF